MIPEDEHPLLVLAGHRERRHDDHEDEEVVDGQALLHDVPGEVLGAESPPHQAGEDQAEDHRRHDIERRPGGGLPVADSVRAYRGQQQVEGEQRHDHTDRERPAARSSPPPCSSPGTNCPGGRKISIPSAHVLLRSLHTREL